MHVYTVITTNSIQRAFKRLGKGFNKSLKVVAGELASQASIYSKSVAPVYDRARWPGYKYYPHHWIPEGTLMNSIRPQKTRPDANIVNSLTRAGLKGTGWYSTHATFVANAKFASYIEHGFWHTKARRWIRGRHFMKFGAKMAIDRHARDKVKAIFKSLMGE